MRSIEKRASFWKRAPKWLQRSYEYWVYLSSLVLFCSAGLITSFLAYLSFLLLPRKLGKTAGRKALMILFRFYTWYLRLWGLMHFDIKAVDKLIKKRGVIIIANHISLWDIVFIISRLPNVVCVTKSSIMSNPIYGGFARLAGFIPNASHINMVKLATKELNSGAQLLIFPEGTRTVTPPINSFKGGFAVISKHAKSPIHTLFISATSPLLGKGESLIQLPDFPYHYTIHSGQSFMIPAGSSTKRFLKILHSYFRENLPPDPRTNAINLQNPPSRHPQL